MYECGDHHAGSVQGTTATRDKLLSWARDPVEGTRAYTEYYKAMADFGVVLACEYNGNRFYGDNTTDVGTFGLLEYPGQTDAAQYLGVVDFITGGGVPKN